MKFILIGLGNFGTSLAEKLTKLGHEVIGVDKNINKVEAIKEKATHAISIDCTDENATKYLPLKDTDCVVVCIGKDEGANIITTAVMKKHKVNRLICRAVSPLHKTILEAMGVTEIIQPEEETSERWAKKLTMKGVVDSYSLSDKYGIIEALLPHRHAKKSIQELNIRDHYEFIILTTIKKTMKDTIFGAKHTVSQVKGVASPVTVLEEGDILVMFGLIEDIQQFISED
ncbi:MAG: TrkA family potassium uptake protein [Bacteroidia bacterium]|jgi:trk system potassium uptake protein TrkA|nr:TrkA family potassium uptake protein [Bacteroidales bacterium]NCD40601.1 TrkA family potassium uptake protein [Bacteroidia bacterium]